jgi:hypothetical protein
LVIDELLLDKRWSTHPAVVNIVRSTSNQLVGAGRGLDGSGENGGSEAD